MLSFYKLGSKFSLGGTNDPHVISKYGYLDSANLIGRFLSIT